MRRADVPVRIRSGVVQITVDSSALQAVVRIAAVIRKAHTIVPRIPSAILSSFVRMQVEMCRTPFRDYRL